MQNITLITTVLNDEIGVKTLFDALVCQRLKPNEIVVVDGGSHDGTVALLESYQSYFPQLKIIQSPKSNISQGRNLAINHASSPIIVVTDAGCRPHENWLYELTKPLLENENIDVVSGQVISEAKTTLEHYTGLLALPDHNSKRQEGLFYGRNSAFRRKVWEMVGGYPEWLYTAEDSLFAISARQRGLCIIHNENAQVFWQPRNSLQKIAKMFFLYGKGNGRIQWGDTKGTLYWLKYHCLLWLSLFLGIFYPPVWLLSLFSLIYLYKMIIYPALKKVRLLDTNWRLELYVPLIAYVRNISTNMGYLYGELEYKRNPMFKKQLDNYLA
ncbi:MAG: glycosyltransferase [Methylococcaceae bacterium]|jgi:glycosyltransferase involved in cell wall biosynthesis